MTNCLNCDEPLSANYCGNCGQKATTHRYSLKHFIEHDLIHSIWHVDRGIFFTIKELFTQPGHSIRGFIDGKRANYFPYLTLIVLLVGMDHFLTEFTSIRLADLITESNKAFMTEFEKFYEHYPKLFILSTIPIYSFFSFLWFRKAKQNFTEHLILNSYKAAAEIIIGLVFTLICVCYHNKQVLFIIYSFVITPMVLLYDVWLYSQYFSIYGYKKYQLILRSIMVLVSASLFLVIIGGIGAIIYKVLGL